LRRNDQGEHSITILIPKKPQLLPSRLRGCFTQQQKSNRELVRWKLAKVLSIPSIYEARGCIPDIWYLPLWFCTTGNHRAKYRRLEYGRRNVESVMSGHLKGNWVLFSLREENVKVFAYFFGSAGMFGLS
jgi:hypothetical protein